MNLDRSTLVLQARAAPRRGGAHGRARGRGRGRAGLGLGRLKARLDHLKVRSLGLRLLLGGTRPPPLHVPVPVAAAVEHAAEGF